MSGWAIGRAQAAKITNLYNNFTFNIYIVKLLKINRFWVNKLEDSFLGINMQGLIDNIYIIWAKLLMGIKADFLDKN